jgi:hypothetical protein
MSPLLSSDKIIKFSSSAIARVVLVLVVIGLVVGGVYLYHSLNPTPYVSKQDNFQIVFPGIPKKNKIAANSVSGISESGRLYNLLQQSSNDEYAVYVIKYSGTSASSLSKSETQQALEGDVDQLAQSDSSRISNGTAISFKNMTAVEATLTPTGTNYGASNVLAFLNKNDLYMIFGSGMSQSKFQSFANTFKLLSK